jgi:molybdopterin synthase catalytic subunit
MAMISGDDLISLETTAIDVEKAIASIGDGDAGGISVFLGTTRNEKNAEGKSLIALDYQAYEEMAVSQMRQFAVRARDKWPIRRLALIHRVGRVEVGKPSVLIAVSTPHRAAAFEACRFLIDTLKAEAAIWKKEVWSDGSGQWVHPPQGPAGR